jgi:hypothetical protein
MVSHSPSPLRFADLAARLVLSHYLSSLDAEAKEQNCFEVSIFMKKRFAFQHHLVGSCHIRSADFLLCLEPKELVFKLQKDGRTGERGGIVATLQFEVSRSVPLADESIRPSHYRHIAAKLINHVALHTLRELPKGAE